MQCKVEARFAIAVVLAAEFAVLTAGTACAQGIVGDVFAGKLINPEVGVFAWYDLTDATTGKKFFLRQAIVGEERVKLKKGYWVETQIIPQVGFPTVYKMLLTGPANDPKNVHQVIVKEGEDPPEVMPIDTSAEAPIDTVKTKRESLGVEKVITPAGEIEAEHVVITGEDGGRSEVWIKDAIRPMGIVRMRSAEGELILRRYGSGGKDAESVLSPTALQEGESKPKMEVKVRVEGGTELKPPPEEAQP